MSNSADEKWVKNPEYPEKRGICEVCKQRDDLKLSFDQVRYICKNSHACMLRFSKMHSKGNNG